MVTLYTALVRTVTGNDQHPHTIFLFSVQNVIFCGQYLFWKQEKGYTMSSAVYLRTLGYIATIILHVGNMLLMGAPKPKEAADDVRLQIFASLQARYLTVWTFTLQVIFAISGLMCDCLTLKNSKTKGYRLPKYLKGFRDTLFAAIIWPSVLVVSTTFWPLFYYDRSLVFPEFLDKVVTSQSNHVMHTIIVPLAVWEVLFQPRTTPKSHLRNVLHIFFHFGLYLAVLFYTFIEKDLWLYPILDKIYGTVYFYVFIGAVFVNSLLFYSLQWPITEIFWGKTKKTMKKKN